MVAAIGCTTRRQGRQQVEEDEEWRRSDMVHLGIPVCCRGLEKRSFQKRSNSKDPKAMSLNPIPVAHLIQLITFSKISKIALTVEIRCQVKPQTTLMAWGRSLVLCKNRRIHHHHAILQEEQQKQQYCWCFHCACGDIHHLACSFSCCRPQLRVFSSDPTDNAPSSSSTPSTAGRCIPTASIQRPSNGIADSVTK